MNNPANKIAEKTIVSSKTPTEQSAITNYPTQDTSFEAVSLPAIKDLTVECSYTGDGKLPDPIYSPGAIFPDVTKEIICKKGYTKKVRDVSIEEKHQVYREYGIKTHKAGQYEVDHIIPLELSGSNDIKNLFPEPALPKPGFHEKDLVENYLNAQVCSGKMKLIDARQAIATNWVTVYNKIK